MNKKILGWALKTPLILMVLASFIAGIYASYVGGFNIDYSAPILIGLFIVLYIIGGRLLSKKELKGGKK